MKASELCGTHIGEHLNYYNHGRQIDMPIVTMITHKKNGNVIVRWMPYNHQREFGADYNIDWVSEQQTW
jgi:hypothetical protein